MKKIARCISLLLSLLITNSVFAESTYDWSGFYLGAFAGGASSAQITSSEPYNPTRGYWNRPYSDPFNYRTGSGFIGGGTVGYNWQFDGTPYLIGLEGQYGYLGLDGQTMDPNATAHNRPSSFAGNQSANVGGSYGYAVIGGRAGYSLDRVLLYVKSGAVFTTTALGYTDPGGTTHINTSSKSNQVGFAIGGGVEYALPYDWAQNISVKAEYFYLGINRTQTSTGMNFGRRSGEIYTSTGHISGIHTAIIGVNYKF